MTSGFKLGVYSRHQLRGVHPDLVRVVERAIQLTRVDFRVTEGLRSYTRQVELVASGASRTMDSRHITGHAVDLAALVGGRASWSWGLYEQLAEAMREAAAFEGVAVTWGGCWDRSLSELAHADITDAVSDYVGRMRAAGRKPFLDGPHFELHRRVYL